jgi:hypothetical protein
MSKTTELFRDDFKQICILGTPKDDCIRLIFGRVHLSINKNWDCRDIAISIAKTSYSGVIFEDIDNLGCDNQISSSRLEYLVEQKAKFEKLKEALITMNKYSRLEFSDDDID